MPPLSRSFKPLNETWVQLNAAHPGLSHAEGSRVHPQEEEPLSATAVRLHVAAVGVPGVLQRLVHVLDRPAEAQCPQLGVQLQLNLQEPVGRCHGDLRLRFKAPIPACTLPRSTCHFQRWAQWMRVGMSGESEALMVFNDYLKAWYEKKIIKKTKTNWVVFFIFWYIQTSFVTGLSSSSPSSRVIWMDQRHLLPPTASLLPLQQRIVCMEIVLSALFL